MSPVNELMVEYFERLVQAQTPASALWQPVTDYSFEARKQIEGQHPELIRDVFQRPHSVLDVGCGPGHLVRLLAEAGIPNVRGCDVAPLDGQPWFFQADITTDELEFHFAIKMRDLVICREVLEHLTIRQVAVAVRNLVRLSRKYIYVTTRFAKNPTHLLDVDTSDDLDPTHITMLTKPFLRTLFVLEGCKSRPDLEAKLDWQNKGRCLVFEVV